MLQGVNLTDIGLADITVEGTTVSVDVVRANNRLAEISDKHKNAVNEQNDATLAYMRELGFPECSHYIACAFASAISDRMQSLKESLKNVASGEPKAGLPASTASIPSDSANTKN